MKFRLLLTEKTSESSIENLFKSNPVLFLDNISATSIFYPANRPALKENHEYVWQVLAYQQGIVLNTSEIWSFKVRCKETSPKPIPDSYRELKSIANANYYIANLFFKFSYFNGYTRYKLNYTLVDPKQPARVFKRLPEIVLQPGLNNVDVDLSDLGLEDGHNYLLRVFPFNKSPIEVTFIYKKIENL